MPKWLLGLLLDGAGKALLASVIIYGLWEFHCELVIFGMESLEQFADLIEFTWPTEMQQAVEVIANWVSYVNAWTPLGFGLACLTFWSTVKIGYISYKFVKSWIPFVSG